jgi:hypothetical protein
VAPVKKNYLTTKGDESGAASPVTLNGGGKMGWKNDKQTLNFIGFISKNNENTTAYTKKNGEQLLKDTEKTMQNK